MGRDIIACGFKKEQTFIFSDLDYMGHMYPNVCRIQKAVTYNGARAMFGFTGESNIGQSAFPAIQAAPSFPTTFTIPLQVDTHPSNAAMPCLIPCAIDQDPYFRMTRDVAHKLVPAAHPLKGKPSLVHSKFFPPLQGSKGKMSASNVNSAVYLTDTPEVIQKKIKEHAVSGGQETSKLQREKGADLDEDVAFQWLRFFLEDDEELEAIARDYKSGSGKYWATGIVKDRLIELLQGICQAHMERRAKITDEEVQEWMFALFIWNSTWQGQRQRCTRNPLGRKRCKSMRCELLWLRRKLRSLKQSMMRCWHRCLNEPSHRSVFSLSA